MTEKKQPDWERIESDYKAGILSLREMAETHGVTHMKIERKAKREGWERNLTGKINQRANALVASIVASEEDESVTGVTDDETVTDKSVTKNVTSGQVVTESDIIESNAIIQSRVILQHRHQITRFRNIALSLISELEGVTKDPELFEELGYFLRQEDDKGVDKRNDLYHRVISMPERVDSLKKLADVLKTLITLERQAFGILDLATIESQQQEQKQQQTPVELARKIAFILRNGIENLPQ